MFTVIRHGGRQTDTYKTVLATDNLTDANEKYHELYLSIRQGSIKLMKDDQEMLSYQCPRLRRLW